jgi:hypothetical protein
VVHLTCTAGGAPGLDVGGSGLRAPAATEDEVDASATFMSVAPMREL